MPTASAAGSPSAAPGAARAPDAAAAISPAATAPTSSDLRITMFPREPFANTAACC
jgi:hypothetical protein